MRIHQALHGYLDGHRQLAASRELPRATRHVMLTLSDMSGRSIVDGFEDYLTAYPLPEVDAYAFARTWYAPEMDRPGCVWTHTLLLENRDIAEVENLADLEAHFARPRGPRSTFDSYVQPFDWHGGTTRPRYPVDNISTAVLSALYATPDVSVLVPVADASVLKDLALALWNQLWSSARTQFTFCTGSIANRSLAGRSFDLQLIPGASAREVKRDSQNALVLDPAFVRSVALEQGLDVLQSDLYEPKSGLRELLEAFGSTLMTEMAARESVEPTVQLILASVELASRSATHPSEVIDGIATRYPEGRQARRLKSMLIKPNSKLMDSLCPGSSEADVLIALAFAHQPDAFGFVELGIGPRAQKLWDEHAEAERTLDALLRRNHNALGEQIIAAILAAAPPDAMAGLLAHHPSVVLSMIRREPALAALPALWQGPWQRQRELFDAATGGVELEEGTTRQIIDAMIEANSDVLAEYVVQRFGRIAADEVLAHALRGSGEISRSWARVASRYEDLLLKRAISTDGGAWAAIAPRVLDPHSKGVRRTELELWAKWLQTTSTASSEVRTTFAAFVLAMLFDRTEAEAATLVTETFGAVHDAAATETLSYDAWAFFENIVPYLSYYRNWDKCERLRRGLVDRFNENEWPVMAFVHCARNREALFDLLRTCHDYGKEGREMLRRIRASQREVLDTLPVEWSQVVRYWI